MAAITITNDGLNLFRDSVSGANKSLISYVALGTSSTPPTVGDHTLGTEVFRKAISSYSNGVNPGEILITLYLGPADAAGVSIQEIGFFGGATASSAPNTGVLVAHGLYSHTKGSTESIQIQLDLII